MGLDRREFAKTLAAGTGIVAGRTYDVAVIGAGVFGAWTAHSLRRAGRSVILVDAYGPGNSRASSGGESRVIRMGYGADEIYTRWSLRSLALWKELSAASGQPLFHRTGVLWISRKGDLQAAETRKTLEKLGVRFEALAEAELTRRYRQMRIEPGMHGIFEPDSGALMARRAVQTVVQQAVRQGCIYLQAAAASPSGTGRLRSLATSGGEPVQAENYVFACGPWLAKVFPGLLGKRIFATRQEVFFFGTPHGDTRFAPPALPVWIDFGDETGPYGIPDLEHRGFKLAFDRHGPPFDPDTGQRLVTPEGLARTRDFLGRRFPALKDAPLLESRVCQYENTSNGDFLIDRHPDFENVWLAGGGSGHGFKHGPALGEYVSARIVQGGPVDPRFTLATKEQVQKRTVY
jgi:glycine/D-amino acid oxidase-like deaminating enzyme